MVQGECNQGQLETDTSSLWDTTSVANMNYLPSSLFQQRCSSKHLFGDAPKPMLIHWEVENQCVCSSALGRLEVSINHGLIFEWAISDLAHNHINPALPPEVQSHFWELSWYFYLILHKSSDFVWGGLASSEASGTGKTGPKFSINLSLQTLPHRQIHASVVW